MPRPLSTLLRNEALYEKLAHDLSKARDVLYLGRGVNYPLALEGALKLKEISYIHAEGYAAGELKHGPIALIDEKVPVIVVAPVDDLFDKTRVQHAGGGGQGRSGSSSSPTPGPGGPAARWRPTSPCRPCIPFANPLLYAVPVQLLAYHTAAFMGTDVDQPRNLAKSVTVE